MTITKNKNLLGMMLSGIGFSLYSCGDFFVKLASEHEYPPEKIAFFLNLFFLPIILILSNRIGGLKATLQTKHLKLHMARALLGMCVFFAMANGFHHLGMALSYTLIFCGPFLVSILSIFFLNEKIGIYRWSSIAVGFLGVLIVLRPGIIPMEPAAIAIIGAAFAYAFSTVIIRKIGDGEPLMAFSFYGVVTALIVFGAMTIYKGEMTMPPLTHLGFFLAIACFSVLGNFCTSRAFQTVDSSIAAPFQYIQLLWGLLFGFLFFNNAIDMWTGIGSAIIVGSGVYMIYREHVRHSHISTGVVAQGGSVENTGLNTTVHAIAEVEAQEEKNAA